MNIEQERAVLAEMPRRLRVSYGVRVPYTKLHRLWMAGDLPAERVGGRIMVETSRTPEIAALLGIADPAQREPA